MNRKRVAVLGGTAAVNVLVSSGASAGADPFGWWANQAHPFAVNPDLGIATPHGDGSVSGRGNHTIGESATS